MFELPMYFFICCPVHLLAFIINISSLDLIVIYRVLCFSETVFKAKNCPEFE